jgi:predicted phosphodiesterase
LLIWGLEKKYLYYLKMARSQSRAAKIVIEELEKHTEAVPSLTIAKHLRITYPSLFDTVESVRSLIRYYRGNLGEKNRNELKDKTFMRENRTPKRALEDYDFSPTVTGVSDYIFPYKKPLILSDIHIPFHDIYALQQAIDYGIKHNCDSIYLNGDILDCSKISSFVPDPESSDFRRERDMFFEFAEYLNTTGLPLFFKVGNHEFRIEYHQRKQNPELAKLDDLSIDRLLHLKDIGMEYISSLQKTKMGDLLVIHGHEFGNAMFSPVNPARGLFLRAKCSVLAGHNHQTSEHQESNLNGQSIQCFSTGCLCTLNPTWRPFAYTKWNLGFAIVEIDEDGGFDVWNKKIVKGKIR